jgi:hypothetical protein
MKIVTIAALAAAQLTAVAGPARAAEGPRGDLAAQQPLGGKEAGTVGSDPSLASMERTDVGDGQTPALLVGSAPVLPHAAAAQEDEPSKKRKSTGDKVLTGAAVILGVGALAVGGLLVAIFLN